MFTATLKRYFSDYRYSYIQVDKNTIEEILVYIYMTHFNSLNPNSKFYIGTGAFGAQACDSIESGDSDWGSFILEKIVYDSTIVFEKGVYISPKTAEALKSFEKIAKNMEARKYGEW